MLQNLLETTREIASAGALRAHVDRLRAARAEARFNRDIAAIMSALDRLSDRQMHLIGVRRDDLFDTVAELMRNAESQRCIAREVADILERPHAGVTPNIAAAVGAAAAAEPPRRTAAAA